MLDSQVNRLFGLLSPVATIRAIVSTVWSPVQSLFGIPRRIASFCAECVRQAMSPFTNILEIVRNPQPDSTSVPNLPFLLTGVPDPTSKQLVDGVKVLQNGGLNTIIKQISRRHKLQEYHHELQNWKEGNEKEMDGLFSLDECDRKTMKSLALSVKRLKYLKARKAKFTKLSNDKMLKMVTKSSLSPEDVKIIQESNKNLTEIESEMNKNKKDCLEMVKTSEKLSHLFTKVLLHSDSFYDYTVDAEMPLNVVNKLRALTYRSQMENDSFKSTLVVTNQKLDKILNATERISTALTGFKEERPDIPGLKNELAALRSQLEQEQLVLRNVKGERDVMKVKLDVLEDLIEDQEIFLNCREIESPAEK